MYPNLFYLIKDLFGIELNALKLVNSFGFFVAMAFVASGYVLYLELKRKAALGEFTYTEEKEIIGAPATTGELLSAGFFGFLFGEEKEEVLMSLSGLDVSFGNMFNTIYWIKE